MDATTSKNYAGGDGAGDVGATAGAAPAAGNTLNSVHLITNRTGTLTSFKCNTSSDRA